MHHIGKLFKPSHDIVLPATLLGIVVIGIMISTTGTAAATSYSISKVQTGLVTSDSLTTGNTTDLTVGGTASAYDYYEDSQGLHIGVQSPSSGQWVNYYAQPPQANSVLYHVLMTIPQTSISDGVFNPALYVEGSDFIPHVGCGGYADSTGYYWAVGQSPDAGQTYTMLYISNPSSLPHTQDCTIITNGNNYLKVYIGGKVVYSNSSMNLGMSRPFVTFVQTDTSSAITMNYATFSNYYVTKGENVKVTNNPSNAATVRVVDSSGKILSSSTVTLGTATLNVGKYTFPLSANINIYDSNNTLIASSPASIYGGDVFSVTSLATVSQPPTKLNATAISSSQISLSWTAPSDNGGSAITGYNVYRGTTPGGESSTPIVTGVTSTTYTDAGLTNGQTYYYKVTAVNSVGESAPSNEAGAKPAPPQISLSWTAPSNNGGSAITGYKIYRGATSNGEGATPIVTVSSSTLSYNDTGLVSGQTYYYKITAVNAVGESPPSNEASAIATSPSSQISMAWAVSPQINVSWKAPSDNGYALPKFTSYRLMTVLQLHKM